MMHRPTMLHLGASFPEDFVRRVVLAEDARKLREAIDAIAYAEMLLLRSEAHRGVVAAGRWYTPYNFKVIREL